MKEVKKSQCCGVELNSPHKHEENCPYKDGVYPVQHIYEGALDSDSIDNFLRGEEHGRE